ncbi:MAG: DUF2070 family protein [Candidatus Bathyarchaeia archaeon]
MGASLSESNIDLAIKHYSSLFTLPSFRTILTLLCLENLLLGLIVVINLQYQPASWIINGLALGILFNAIIVLLDFLVARILLKKDAVLNYKRLSFLSFSANLFYIAFMIIGIMLLPESSKNQDLFIKILSICFFANLSFRTLVIYSTSLSNFFAKSIASGLQPFTILSLLILIRVKVLHVSHIMHIIAATVLSLLSVYLFITLLNREGEKALGIPSLKIFRAFLANWTESLEEPFEEILEGLGEERDITVSLIIFRSRNSGDLKAAIVVPNLHPGPFKNIGSSSLPSLIKDLLEKECGCIVSVPHGISGHSLDLVSQKENKKVLESLLRAMKEPHVFSKEATIFFNVEDDGAKVGCQVFDKCVFLTLTLSPETMEDLPIELNDIIIQEAMKNGFSWAIAVDSHNSLNGPFNVDRAVKIFRKTITSALNKARSLERFSETLMIGAGEVRPKDLSTKDGIGPGGITSMVVSVGDQKTAYVTIDGNNMVSGLREKILMDLKDLGISGGEVFTTDTHIVNAIVLNERGYHPVGEVIDHGKLIGYIRSSVIRALNNMELAEVAWCKVVIPKVKVIGDLQINQLSALTDKVLKKAKKYLFIFALSGFLLTIM